MDTTTLVSEAVEELISLVGAGRAAHILGVLPPGAPAEGVNEYDSRVRLAAHLEGIKSGRTEAERKVALSVLKQIHDFLVRHREERLRQAKATFNAALTLALVGTGVILVGVVMLLMDHVRAGTVSAAAGVVSNIISALLFKMNKDANDRLDKVTAQAARLGGIRRVLG